jgi:hypothetical protein
MSFINGLSDFTVTTSYQPSCTVTHKGSRRGDHAGAAMFMRSTPGCGTLAVPSLEWMAFRSPRPNDFAESPGLKRLGALGRPTSGFLTCPDVGTYVPISGHMSRYPYILISYPITGHLFYGTCVSRYRDIQYQDRVSRYPS